MKHFLHIAGLNPFDLMPFLDHGLEFIKNDLQPLTQIPLKNRLIFHAFFENSTRTNVSFESAALRLGAQVIHFNVHTSSIHKGESDYDTFQTLLHMRPDAIVLRHPHAGAAHFMAQYASCPIINAGDGQHEHPTQALTDALCILDKKGSLAGLNIVICGDILHSRVAYSNIMLLTTLGACVKIVAPPPCIAPALENLDIEVFCQLSGEILETTDVLMLLRPQMERIHKYLPFPTKTIYHQLYGLNAQNISFLPANALILHPGPTSRDTEIDSWIMDNHPAVCIHHQVLCGIAARMSVLHVLFHS